MSLDPSDERWSSLKGGYRVPYDPRPALRRIETGEPPGPAWDELWEELFHQEDVGEASYAAVPEIARLIMDGRTADWNGFALVATIEERRGVDGNPPLPAWLIEDYEAAWQSIFAAAVSMLATATDETLLNALLGVIAIRKKLPTLGRLALRLSENERRALLDEVGWV